MINFPSPAINGQTYTTGTVTYVYNSAQASWIVRQPSTLSLNTLTITGILNSVSTTTGAVVVAGGVGVGGNLYAGALYDQGSRVVTTASISGYGVATVSAGTDTAVNTSSGNIVVWNTSTLQSVTNRGATTTNAISINTTTDSTSTITGALIVQGGIGVGESIYVGSTGTFYDVAIGRLLSVTSNITSGGNITSSGTLFVSTVTSTGDNLYLTTGTGTGTVYANGVDLLGYAMNVYFVTSNGSDSNDGRRTNSGFATIKHALSLATTGTVVYVEAGNYVEAFPLTIPAGVTVKGSSIRGVQITPTFGTRFNDAFYLNGETTLTDLVISGFFQPGWAFKFAPNAKITTKSPYIERVSVITRGSVTSSSDPYGFLAGNAGHGAYLDASVLQAGSLEPAMLWNEVTFIVPNATGMYMTNGCRAELLNGFFYFANKAIDAEAGITGLSGAGQTRLKVQNVTGNFVAGDKLVYKDPYGNYINSATIASTGTGGYIYLNGPAWGYSVPVNRVPETVTLYGNAQTATGQKKFGSSSLYITQSGDYAEVLSDPNFQFGSTKSYTIETWVQPISSGLGNLQTLVIKGADTTASNCLRIFLDTNNHVNAQHGTTIITGTTALSANAWANIAVVRNATSSSLALYVNGNLEASTSSGVTSNVNSTDPFDIGSDGQYGTFPFIGYMDELRVSNIARYSNINPINTTTGLTSDVDTVLMLHFEGPNSGTSVTDDNITTQNIYSLGTSPSTAQQTILADYHQFGAELRCIGSAAVFGNSGVTANGTGTDLKLIAFNMSYIGSGGDLSDDITLVNQAKEVIQTNGGVVYYQTVDQNGDFRVGSAFLVNQRTGAVTFSASNLSLNNLTELYITDGVNLTALTPGNVSAGNMEIGGNTLASLSGNININPAGTLTNILSNLNVAGGVNIGGSSYINGSPILTLASVGSYGVTYVDSGPGISVSAHTGTVVISNTGVIAILAGTDIAVSTSTGTVSISDTSTLQSVTSRGATTNKIITISTTTPSSNYANGALVVAGGVGVGGSLNVAGAINVNVFTATTLTVLGNETVAGTLGVYGNTSLGGTLFVTSGTTLGSTLVVTGTTTLSNLTVNNPATVNSTLNVTGQTTLAGLIANTSTVTSLTVSGILTSTNISNSVSTNTGAIVAVGGVGIAQDLWVGGTIYGTLSGSVTTATNIRGGTPGQIPYQTATGITSFFGPGATGTVLVSYGTTGTPTFQNTLTLAGTSASTSTTTGALQVAGGVGIGGDTYIGGLVDVGTTVKVHSTASAISTNSGALQVAGGAGFGGDIYANNLYATGGKVTFQNTVTISSSGLTGNIFTTYATAINLGLAATQIIVGANNGISAVVVNPTTQSISSGTGALIVNGGAGISGNLYVGGVVVANTFTGSITTATNLAGGNTGSLPYQTAPGITNMLPLGTSNQVLVVNPTGTGVQWSSSINFAVNTATNLASGLAGQVPYQSAPGTTLFTGPGTTGQLFISSGGGAPTFTNTNTFLVGYAVNANNVYTAPVVDNSNYYLTFVNTSTSGYNSEFVNNGLSYNPLSGVLTSPALYITNTTTSLSTQSGAVIVTGGVGIGGTLYASSASINNVIITSGVNATNSTTGALVVHGGVGVSNDVIIGGNLSIYGNFTSITSGTVVTVNSTQTSFLDPIIALGGTNLNAPLAINDGSDRGFIFYYSTTATSNTAYNNHAFLGMDNTTHRLEYKTNVYPGAPDHYTQNGYFSTGTWGTAQFGQTILVGGNSSSSTGTGDLIAVGGAGIGGNIYVGGNAVIGTPLNFVPSQGGIQYGSNNNNPNQVIIQNTNPGNNASSSFLAAYDSGNNTYGYVNFGIASSGYSQSNQTLISPGDGFLYVNGNTTTNVGNLVIGAATSKDIIFTTGGLLASNEIARFNNSLQSFIIKSSTNATNDLTGSLTVLGGAGIQKDVYIGGSLTVLGTVNATINGSITTATNIANGTAGQIPYQTATGITSFFGPGSIGQVLVSGGATGTPTFQSTLTLSSSTIATSTQSGALQVVGGVGIGQNLYVGGIISQQNNALVYDQSGITVGTSATPIDTFAIATYRTAKYVISVSNTALTQYQSTEILVIHNGTTPYLQDVSVFTGASALMTFTVSIATGILTLSGTGANTGNTVKVQKIYITA